VQANAIFDAETQISTPSILISYAYIFDRVNFTFQIGSGSEPLPDEQKVGRVYVVCRYRRQRDRKYSIGGLYIVKV